MKWNNYYRVYAEHFPNFPERILEIGVKDGDGLRYLHDRFPAAQLFGVDLYLSAAAKHAADDTEATLFRCNQCHLDKTKLVREPGGFDIIIDDGGHRPYQQALAFDLLWPRLNEDGVYAIEDLHLGQRLRWRLFEALCPWWSIQRRLRKLTNGMNRWYGPEAMRWVSPATILFTPQLVIIKKDEADMKVE